MQYKFVIFSLLIISITACKKDCETVIEPPLIEPESAAEYSQLEIGNYWVYQRFTIDLETGMETEYSQLDSIFIEKDTLIEGHTYYELKGTWFGLNFGRLLRNEGEYLVNQEARTYMTTLDIFDTLSVDLNPGIFGTDSLYLTLTNMEENVIAPAGVFFSEHQYERIFFLNQELFGHEYTTRFDTEYYVKDLGVVKYTSFFSSSPVNTEMRLIRYYVN